MSESMIRLLIADDHNLFREGIINLLAALDHRLEVGRDLVDRNVRAPAHVREVEGARRIWGGHCQETD